MPDQDPPPGLPDWSGFAAFKPNPEDAAPAAVLGDFRGYHRAGWALWRRDFTAAAKKHLPWESAVALATAVLATIDKLAGSGLDAASLWEAVRSGLVSGGALLLILVFFMGVWHLFGTPHRLWASDDRTLRELKERVEQARLPTIAARANEPIAFHPEQPEDAPWPRNHFLIFSAVTLENLEKFAVRVYPILRLHEDNRTTAELAPSNWPVSACEQTAGRVNLQGDIVLQPGESRTGYLAFVMSWNTLFVGPWLQCKFQLGATVYANLILRTGNGKERDVRGSFNIRVSDLLPRLPAEWIALREKLERGSSVAVEISHDETNDASVISAYRDGKRVPALFISLPISLYNNSSSAWRTRRCCVYLFDQDTLMPVPLEELHPPDKVPGVWANDVESFQLMRNYILPEDFQLSAERHRLFLELEAPGCDSAVAEVPAMLWTPIQPSETESEADAPES